jgi:hypothetical protein
MQRQQKEGFIFPFLSLNDQNNEHCRDRSSGIAMIVQDEQVVSRTQHCGDKNRAGCAKSLYAAPPLTNNDENRVGDEFGQIVRSNVLMSTLSLGRRMLFAI